MVEAADALSTAAATETANPSDAVPRIQIKAWHWAVTNRHENGSLPTGREIAIHFDHKERWGRLVKQRGQQGRFDQAGG